MTARNAGNNNDPPAIIPLTGLEIQIKETKLYVPVLTLSKENYIKLLEQLKLGFDYLRTIKWNKYRSQMTIQNNDNNLNYLIDPTFTNVSRLFVLLFKKIQENNIKKDHRDSFSHYYLRNVEIKNFSVLIDGKSFFDLPVENKEEAYEKIIEKSEKSSFKNQKKQLFSFHKIL